MAKSRVRVETPAKPGEFKLWLTHSDDSDYYIVHKEEPERDGDAFTSPSETELCSEAADLLTGGDTPDSGEVFEITLQRVSLRKGRAEGIVYE